MRAVVVNRYGPPEVASVVEVADPAPKPDEVVVSVRAAAVASGDARIRAARFPRGFALPARLAIGIRGPRRPVLGVVLAGTVTAVGADVRDLSVGDEVAGMTGARFGAHAERAAVQARRLVLIPADVSHRDAAGTLFGGSTALHFLRKAGLTTGARVLVNGGSGAVGSSAVQIAHRAGAQVTAVSSSRNADLVRRLGADVVVDRERQAVGDIAERFDIVLDTVGTIDRRTALRLAGSDGRVALIVASLGETITARGRVLAGPAPERPEVFTELLAMVAAGDLDPLTRSVGGLDAIREAYEIVDSGRKVGNLVIEPQA